MSIASLQSFDWDHLRFFLAVARERSLAGAARQLGVNHSTVFRRINALERDLGARLFDRLPEGYALTVAGEEMLIHAREIDDAVAALSRASAGKDYRLTGDIRLTTAPALATHFVARALPGFRRAYPDIRIEIAVGDSDYDLARREADLALRATSKPPEYLVGRRIVRLPWFFYGATRGPRPRDLEQLERLPLIGADAGMRRLPAFRRLHDRFGRDRFAATSNSLTTMAALARSGAGIACLPADQGGPGLRRLFELEPRTTSDIWLLTHPDLRRVARIRTFADYLFDWIRKDARIRPFVD